MIDSVIRALGMAVAMGWDILRPLILGFALSAVVKAAVSKQQMSCLLPDDRPRSIATALALGAASSSCFYAAVALAARSSARARTFTPAMAFEMASALQQLHSRPVRAQCAGGRSLHQLELYDWLTLALLVLG
jgi:uncharacterized protein